ncbi:MAG: hypothetical protein KC468_20000 [Myxococcales bacterium]|nr:hypothetical protein [Myxococcales bacterium]
MSQIIPKSRYVARSRARLARLAKVIHEGEAGRYVIVRTALDALVESRYRVARERHARWRAGSCTTASASAALTRGRERGAALERVMSRGARSRDIF